MLLLFYSVYTNCFSGLLYFSPQNARLASSSHHASPSLGHGLAIIAGFLYSIGSMVTYIFGQVDWSLYAMSQGGYMIIIASVLLSYCSSSKMNCGVITNIPALAVFTLFLICVFDVTGLKKWCCCCCCRCRCRCRCRC